MHPKLEATCHRLFNQFGQCGTCVWGCKFYNKSFKKILIIWQFLISVLMFTELQLPTAACHPATKFSFFCYFFLLEEFSCRAVPLFFNKSLDN